MEINDKATRWNFDDVKVGECFKAHEILFLKVEPFYDNRCDKIWNAIRLKNGVFWSFRQYDKIRKVKAIIECEEI